MDETSEPIVYWSVDDLLDEDPLSSHGPDELSIAWTQLHWHLHENEPRVVSAFCTAVRRKRKTAAKLVALHLARVAVGELAKLIEELVVEDRLLYAHYRGSKLMASAIEARWDHLDGCQRAAVVTNIEASDAASPSYADMRALIAAIPVCDRPPALETRLVELGGPRPPNGSEALARSHDDDEPDPAPRSLAERMADVPLWLEADPILWHEILCVLLEDERAQRVDASDRPARLLTSDTARRVAIAAFEAMTAFRSGVCDDVTRIMDVLDIVVAFPPHREDETMNARLIEVLRTYLVVEPVDDEIAVHALTSLWPGHWRLEPGRKLLLEVIRDANDPRVVEAALDPLSYAEEATILQAFALLTDSTKVATITSNASVAREMGQLLGGRAPWRASLVQLLLTWLERSPTGRFLSSDTEWNEFLGGVAFALKNEAHHVPCLDPLLYAQLATALWSAWQSPRSRAGDERNGIALLLMSPIHHIEGFKRVTARYWPALKALFEEILKTGDGEDVSGALFHLDLGELQHTAIEDLASMLRAAAHRERSVEVGSDSRERVAQILRDIGLLDLCTRPIASDIHQTLVSMGARKEALDVKQRWESRE